MNRTQARAQARQEGDIALKLRRSADKLWTAGERQRAEAMYAEARTHDAQADEFAAIAAGTKKHMDTAPVRDAASRVAPDDF